MEVAYLIERLNYDGEWLAVGIALTLRAAQDAVAAGGTIRHGPPDGFKVGDNNRRFSELKILKGR